MSVVEQVAEFFATSWFFNIQYDLGRYLVVAPAVFLLVHVVFRTWFGRRKIQSRRAQKRDIRREVLYSILTAVIFATVGVSVFAGVDLGVMEVYDEIGERGGPYFALTIVTVIVAHDAYFYWTHRLMHQPRLFRFFHLTHHRSRVPTPFAAYAFAPAEAVVQASFLPLFMLVMPMNSWALFIFLAHMIVRNAVGHSGHEWFPRGAVGSPWLGWLTTVTHHDMHHENVRGNYGLYFTWWDKLMGTEQRGYRARFDQVTAGLCAVENDGSTSAASQDSRDRGRAVTS